MWLLHELFYPTKCNVFPSIGVDVERFVVDPDVVLVPLSLTSRCLLASM